MQSASPATPALDRLLLTEGGVHIDTASQQSAQSCQPKGGVPKNNRTLHVLAGAGCGCGRPGQSDGRQSKVHVRPLTPRPPSLRYSGAGLFGMNTGTWDVYLAETATPELLEPPTESSVPLLHFAILCFCHLLDLVMTR